ncbi:hypothetical protein BJY00DRAFT_104506 [Aspergillus carlsbadensis]|nr:hypothetical protein BJY00DRAFT_104506 [Aspergillus carlsbadensis]
MNFLFIIIIIYFQISSRSGMMMMEADGDLIIHSTFDFGTVLAVDLIRASPGSRLPGLSRSRIQLSSARVLCCAADFSDCSQCLVSMCSISLSTLFHSDAIISLIQRFSRPSVVNNTITYDANRRILAAN